jgi:hypothetical protein
MKKPSTILIPWDGIFTHQQNNDEEHLIVITNSMERAISFGLELDPRSLIHNNRPVTVSCFRNKCLQYSDAQMESVYEAIKNTVFQIAASGGENWVIGPQALLLEFEGFISTERPLFLDPGNIFPPSLIKLSDFGEKISFDYVRGKDVILCYQ